MTPQRTLERSTGRADVAPTRRRKKIASRPARRRPFCDQATIVQPKIDMPVCNKGVKWSQGMLRRILFGAGLLLSFSGSPSHATILQESFSQTGAASVTGAGSFLDTVAPSFDPALGTLNSISVSITASGSAAFSAPNATSGTLKISYTFHDQPIYSENIVLTDFFFGFQIADHFAFPTADLSSIAPIDDYIGSFSMLGQWTACNGSYCNAILNPINGTFVLDYTPAAVPEPPSASLLIPMLAGVGLLQRMRRFPVKLPHSECGSWQAPRRT